MSCDVGQHVIVCRLTDESLAASFIEEMHRAASRRARRQQIAARKTLRRIRMRAVAARAVQRALRDEAIRRERAETGDTLQAIADRHGLTKQRVEQIVNGRRQ